MASVFIETSLAASQSISGLDESRVELFNLANEFMALSLKGGVGFECNSLRAKLKDAIDCLDCMEMATVRFSPLEPEQQAKFDAMEDALRLMDAKFDEAPGLSQLPHHIRKVARDFKLPEKIRSFTCSVG